MCAQDASCAAERHRQQQGCGQHGQQVGSDVARPADPVLLDIGWDGGPDLGQLGGRDLRFVQHGVQGCEDAVRGEGRSVVVFCQFTTQLRGGMPGDTHSEVLSALETTSNRSSKAIGFSAISALAMNAAPGF